MYLWSPLRKCYHSLCLYIAVTIFAAEVGESRPNQRAVHATAAVFSALALAVYEKRAVVVREVDTVIIPVGDIVVSK